MTAAGWFALALSPLLGLLAALAVGKVRDRRSLRQPDPETTSKET